MKARCLFSLFLFTLIFSHSALCIASESEDTWAIHPSEKTPASSPKQDYPLYVNLKDLIQYTSGNHTPLETILDYVEENKETLFETKFRKRRFGGNWRSGVVYDEGIYGIELRANITKKDKILTYPLTAFYKRDPRKHRYAFLKFDLKYDEARQEIVGAFPVQKIDLEDTEFQIKVGLFKRTEIFVDHKNDLVKIYPIAVGMLNEQMRTGARRRRMTESETTRIQGGYVKVHPRYMRKNRKGIYKNLPHIGIFKKGRTRPTLLALHIRMNKELRRGFDSHGCLRHRGFDLMEAYKILRYADREKTRIDIAYKLREELDHPYPRENVLYKTIYNRKGGDLACNDPEVGKAKLNGKQKNVGKRCHPQLPLDLIKLEGEGEYIEDDRVYEPK